MSDAAPTACWAHFSIERHFTAPTEPGAPPSVVHEVVRVDIERRLAEVTRAGEAERTVFDLARARQYTPLDDPLDEVFLPEARGKRWLVQGITPSAYVPRSWPLLCDPARALETLRALASTCVEEGREPVDGAGTTRYRLTGLPSRLDEAQVWVGDDGLARRLVVRQSGVELRIAFDAFNAPVTVALPAPEDVIDAEEAIAPDAFGTGWTTDGLFP